MRVDARVPQEYNRINLEPISGALGAIVHGVDMRELDDEIITELHQAWMDHKVLFFRDQELTPAQHVEYGKAFGNSKFIRSRTTSRNSQRSSCWSPLQKNSLPQSHGILM